jgi:4'-phosphopantetheinyl transferase
MSLKKPSILPLNPDEVHLWFAFPDEIQDRELLSAYQELMTEEEYARQQRFRFAKHQHLFLIARALVRTTLSRYTDVEPQDWRFSKNTYGKPSILASENSPPLSFNLSHTEGLIVCGVVLKQEIGVDVEDGERNCPLEIADRFFSLQEVKNLYALSSKVEQQNRFFDYWVLKESYIKARGMGLSLPLEQFTFHISKNQPLRISFDRRLQDSPDDWQFWLLQPTQRHKAAISLNQKTNQPYRIVTKKVVPLFSEQEFFCPIIQGSS